MSFRMRRDPGAQSLAWLAAMLPLAGCAPTTAVTNPSSSSNEGTAKASILKTDWKVVFPFELARQ